MRILERLFRTPQSQEDPPPLAHVEVGHHTTDTYWRILRTLPDGTLIDRQKYPDSRRRLTLTHATPLFEAAGITPPFPVCIREIPNVTYPLEARPEDNWVFYALKAFQELKRRLMEERKSYDRFLTIGSGPGLDAIGAHYVFDPGFLTVTDISDPVSYCAEMNTRNNLRPGHCMYTFGRGDLFENIPAGCQYDVIYANIPNIPEVNLDAGRGVRDSTFVDAEALAAAPKIFQDHLLANQWRFLKQAGERGRLAPGGSVVLALGGRVWYRMIQYLFEDTGFKLEVLGSDVKIQTQPDEVIPGYAAAEEKHGMPLFTFINMDDWAKYRKRAAVEKAKESSGRSPRILRPEDDFQEYAISAREALVLHNAGRPVGHRILMLRGIKQEVI